MKKSGVVAAIQQQEALAVSGDLAEAREEAVDHYLGRPYGNEIDGRSSVVMRDVADTIEWIKPSLMKIFASGDEVCKFVPTGPEDVAQAEQETEYCNWVLMQKNNGFVVLHDWFHDALLQRNGYVMVQHEVEKVPSRESYRGLSDDELALLMQGEPEVLQYTANPTPEGVLHDIVVRETKEYGCTKVTNIAPERVLISADWPDLDLQGCPFVEVIAYPTISDLRQEGYDVDDDISDNGGEDQTDPRRTNLSDRDDDDHDQQADPATRRVKTRYVWIRFDADGDGIAELRRVVIVGTTILEDEETDLTPVAALTPFRLPHEHNGQSVDDIVQDLQEIRTTLTRGFLDNMYLANNGRYAIDANVVNMDDMLVARPGGVVRVQGQPGTAIAPLIHPQNGRDIIQAIEYVDTVRENRTGVTKYNQGLDSQSLNKTAHGVSQIMTASQQRIELIARIFAETGVKALFMLIHAVSVANGRKAEMIKLRNDWVAVDPSSWKSRRDVSVSVGLGTGNKDQMLQHLQMILTAQAQGLQIGVTTPQNIYNALVKLTQNAGFKQPEEFWTDPAKQPPQPPPPNPDVIKAQADQQKTQAQIQADQQKTAAQLEADAQKFQAEAMLEQERMQFDAEQKERDRQLQARLAEMQEATKVAIARMGHDTKLQTTQYTENMRAKPIQAQVDNSQLGEVLAGLQQTMQAMAESLNRPKTVIRGPDGRVAGVQ